MTLEQLRAVAGLTQVQLAEKAGVAVSSISSWENGSAQPRAFLISRLANALGVSVPELYKAIEETKQQKGK